MAHLNRLCIPIPEDRAPLSSQPRDCPGTLSLLLSPLPPAAHHLVTGAGLPLLIKSRLIKGELESQGLGWPGLPGKTRLFYS